MSNKLYEENDIRAIADAIRAKGVSGTMTVAQMPSKVAAITAKETVTWHQCPEAVRNYLANVTYDPSDYTTSQIATYAPGTAVRSNTKPVGKTVDGVTYYNEVPNVATPFSSANTAGTLTPLDRLRWINTTTAPNVRDLGGWTCDGGTVKYGLLFRGGNESANDRNVLVNECGVKAELDLRGLSESGGATSSPMGDDIIFCRPDSYNYYSLTDYPDHTTKSWKDQLRFIFDCVNHNIPVYFHCTSGADRTGTLACILEAMLGMSQSDIDKDYELTCFYTGTSDDNTARRRNERAYWGELIRQINALAVGSTFRDKVINWVASLGFTAAEINAFRAAMINGTPATVTPITSTYTVTKSGTNATITGENTATQYQHYKATITPASDYELSAVTVTMGGVNVKSDSYKEYIFPTNGGEIDIQNVTGNISVSATAVPVVIPIENLAETYGVAAEYRLSASTGANSSYTGYCVVGSDKSAGHIVPMSVGDVFRIKGADIPASQKTTCGIAYYDDLNGTYSTNTFNYLYQGADNALFSVSSADASGVVAVTIKARSGKAGLRFSIPCTNTANLIITKNQAI